MPDLNRLNVLRRIGRAFTPPASPATAPGAAGPAAGPQHPDLMRRTAPAGGMAPRNIPSALHSTFMRHDRLPPKFQSPAHGMPATHAHPFAAPAAFHRPGFGFGGVAGLRRPSGVLSPQAAQALGRLSHSVPAPIRMLLASALPLLDRLAGHAQHFQSGIPHHGHAAAHPAAHHPVASALGILQRLMHDLASGHLGGHAGHAPAGPHGFQPHHPAAHAAPGGYGFAPQPAASFYARPNAGAGAFHAGGPGAFHAQWGPAAGWQVPPAGGPGPNMHGPSAPEAPTQPSRPTGTPVNVLDGSLAEARAALKASYGNDEQAKAGMHRMAMDLKTALQTGSTADLEAFRVKYQERLQLPAGFATDAAARARLAKVLNESMKANGPSAGPSAGPHSQAGKPQPASAAPAPGAAAPPAAAASSQVFSGPTRPAGSGFDERQMYARFSSCPEAVALEKAAARHGFRYVGDTGSASKANTEFDKRQIRINANLSPEMAALSLAYELSNAAQMDEFRSGPLQLWKQGANDLPTAEKYAEGVLRKEARSVLMRSKVAVSMGRPDLVKNARYNEIAQDTGLSEDAKVDAVFAEMKKNGTVHQGKTSAFDHYVEQYLAHKDAVGQIG
jgi:hypothetical protein